MSDMVTGDFNYASVDEETAAKLEYFAKTGKALIRKSQTQFIADFGKLLSEARAMMAHHGDGKFINWATAEFDISAKTAYRYISAWDKCLCHGVTNYLNWSATALYLLAADEIPGPVQKKLEQIPSTDLVRACDVKRMIEASKPKPDTVDDPPFDAAPEMTLATRAMANAAVANANKKEVAAAVKLKAIEEAAAAKAKAKAAKEKAALEALPEYEQVKMLRSIINQLIGKTLRAVDDLNRVRQNRPKHDALIKTLKEIVLW